MRLFFIILSVAALSVSTVKASTLNDVGVMQRKSFTPERNISIEMTVFYPAMPDGEMEIYGESQIFTGVNARREATPLSGKFPVLLLSHGGLRSNPVLSSWLSTYLASHGKLVVVLHPPKLTGENAQSAITEVWARSADISGALTSINADPILASHIDSDKVVIVGAFLGGTSAMLATGAKLDVELYMEMCGRVIAHKVDCNWFSKNAVDFQQLNKAIGSVDRKDDRIKAVVGVNPELSELFIQKSLLDIKIPTGLIVLGDVDGGKHAFETMMSDMNVTYIGDANSNSMFNECTAKARFILDEEGEDSSICDDVSKRSRKEIQLEIGALINEFVSTSLR